MIENKVFNGPAPSAFIFGPLTFLNIAKQVLMPYSFRIPHPSMMVLSARKVLNHGITIFGPSLPNNTRHFSPRFRRMTVASVPMRVRVWVFSVMVADFCPCFSGV
jgi:hypothetical protein